MRLFLMRHATTEPGKGKSDFDRNLTEKGKKEAAQASEFLSNHKIDKAIVSYVKRTVQTSNIVQKNVDFEDAELVTTLYKGDKEEIINLLASQNNQNQNILVIGHNPLIFDVAMNFALPSSKYYEALVEKGMPPARIIILDFPKISEWQDLPATKGKIIGVFTASV